jgi:hypothetical protein
MPGENIQDWSITAATNATADSLINWAEGMPRADVNNSARSMMAAHAKDRNLNNGSIVTTGTAAVQGFATPLGYSSVPTNMRVVLKMGFTNAANVLLSMDGTAAVAIKDLYGNNLKAGVLPINSFAEFIYNGTNWILLGTPMQAVAGVTDGSSAAAGMVGEVQSGASGNWGLGVGQVGTLVSFGPLTAGDWEVWGVVAGSGTPSTYGILLVGNTLNSTGGAYSVHGIWAGASGQFYGGTTPMTVNITTAAPIYLNLASDNGAFSGTAGTARIFARRMH